MGVVLSRLWTTKRSFREHLEHLEAEMKRIETAQQRNAIIKRQLISSIVLWSSVLYILSFVAYYLFFFPATWTLRILYALPFVVAPVFIFLMNRCVNFYIERRFQKFTVKLRELKNEKKKILEEVIETESFKNAKELLERFDPDSTFLRPTQLNSSSMVTPVRGAAIPLNPNTPIPVTPHHNMELRQRKCASPDKNTECESASKPVAATTPQPRSMTSNTPPKRSVKPQRKLNREVTPTPKPQPPKVMSSSGTQTTSSKTDKLIPTGVANRTPQVQIVREYLLPGHVKNERAGGPPLAQQILPSERSSMDKVVEFVIGDGPNNRFALICSQCHSHNGMALPEHFDYTTFRCAYCYTVNPARRNAPVTNQHLYKLPNIQVKPPEIIEEITPRDDDTECGPSIEPCGTPEPPATPESSEESDMDEESDVPESTTDVLTAVQDKNRTASETSCDAL